MKKNPLFIFLFVLLALPTFGLTLESARKIMTLPGGEAVCDLNGEWDAQVVYNELWKFAGTYNQPIQIKQEGRSFSGILTINDRYLQDQISIRGELYPCGIGCFKKVQMLASEAGFLDASGEISENCNKMIIHIPDEVRVTYTRK